MWLSHTSWFITPSSTKDDSGSRGGTLQCRITCKDFQHQTDPAPLLACRQSRWHGGCLATMDLDQAELRTAALLSGEDTLIRAFLNDLDVHTGRAVSIWGAPSLVAKYPELAGVPEKRWKKASPGFNDLERDVGKHVNFADLFWASPPTIQATILKMSGKVTPLSMLELAVSRRPLDRPQLWSWQNDLVALARAQGYISLPFLGLSRYFSGGSKDETSEIINFPVQSTAAAALLFIQFHIFPRLRPDQILCYLNVYDSLSFDIRYPSRGVPLLRDLIAEAVTQVTTVGYWSWLQDLYSRHVPLTYSLSIGDPS